MRPAFYRHEFEPDPGPEQAPPYLPGISRHPIRVGQQSHETRFGHVQRRVWSPSAFGRSPYSHRSGADRQNPGTWFGYDQDEELTLHLCSRLLAKESRLRRPVRLACAGYTAQQFKLPAVYLSPRDSRYLQVFATVRATGDSAGRNLTVCLHVAGLDICTAQCTYLGGMSERRALEVPKVPNRMTGAARIITT